jgi:nicotinate-nucleotide adenylyltransferase
MRIGLFGGTYNPIHFGHLRVATEVREAFDLDRIVLIPAARPPHKSSDDLIPSAERLQMLHLAVDNDPDLEISDVELRRTGPSYTVDTLAHFQSRLDSSSRLFLIMGLDAILEIDTWKSYRRLLAGVPLIIISRPDPLYRSVTDGWQRLEHYLKTVVSPGYAFSDAENAFVANDMAPIYLLTVSALDISSTRIRKLVQSGLSIRYLVPDSVADYIAAKGLYV